MRHATLLFSAVSMAALTLPGSALAATHKHPAHKRHAAGASAPDGERALLTQEVAELRAELNNLRQEVAAQRQSQASTAETVAATQVQVASVARKADETALAVPAAARTEVASALTKEHRKGYVDFKGIRIAPGGFLELAGIYRQNFQGNDIATSWSIPFPNNRPAAVSEWRFSARQSRLSFLADGAVSKTTHVAMYGEFDFQGGAQTANSNESNSFNPRGRHLYATIDWDNGNNGVHLLAGQTWSLATLNTHGITPRSELTPPGIDAQYVPGFVWARQPQVRLTLDTADHHLWFAVSAENPATTFGGPVPAFVTNTAPAGSGFDSANSLSLNGRPDLIGKVAYSGELAGHSVQLEGFALSRVFTAHLNGIGNVNKAGYGYGGGLVLQLVPGLIDAQLSGMAGKGIGRYGSAQLPDTTFDANGGIYPVAENMLLGGITLHATKQIDLYGFAGREHQSSVKLGTNGIGLATANNSGCLIEGGTCAGNTREIRQLTAGIWDKIYSGSFGRVQIGAQFSYTTRQLFDGVGGGPEANQRILMTSLRYYPF